MLQSAASGGIGTLDSKNVLEILKLKLLASFKLAYKFGEVWTRHDQPTWPSKRKTLKAIATAGKSNINKALLALFKEKPRLEKSFVPQIQSSFVKRLFDSNRLVRARGYSALTGLFSFQSRLDPLLVKLKGLALNELTVQTRLVSFQACSQIFCLGNNLSGDSFPKHYLSCVRSG